MTFPFLVQMYYGDPIIRKSVPLALGLISASNPQLTILDTLSKYSHDNDLEVALNAIFAMGLVGAGTNNARLAQMLRQLAGYYQKEPDCLFMVRVSQVSRTSGLESIQTRRDHVGDDRIDLSFFSLLSGSRPHGQGNHRRQPLPLRPIPHVAYSRRRSPLYPYGLYRCERVYVSPLPPSFLLSNWVTKPLANDSM
jgi:hypothetical protein